MLSGTEIYVIQTQGTQKNIYILTANCLATKISFFIRVHVTLMNNFCIVY